MAESAQKQFGCVNFITTYKFIIHVWFCEVQKEGERIDAYVTDLKKKFSSCEFENLQDSLIRDRIKCGIKRDAFRKILLREENLTLQRAIDICGANEASESQIKIKYRGRESCKSRGRARRTWREIT